MVAAWKSVSGASASVGGNAVVTKPSGTVDGDLLVAVGVIDDGSTINAPGGWNLHASSLGNDKPLWTKTASSEGASYTFTPVGVLPTMAVVIVRYDGQASVDAASGISGTGALVIPALTSGGANRLLPQIALHLGGGTWTGPGSQSERFDQTMSSVNNSTAGGDEMVGSGSTGTRTWTPGTSGSKGVAYMLALAPSSVDATVTVPAAATATASAGTPAAAAGSTVVGVAAASTAAGVAPSLAAGSSLAAVTATATSEAHAPTFSAGVGIEPPAAEATADGVAPSLLADANLSVPTAEATATSPFGGVVTSAGVTITPSPVTATADLGTPALSAGSDVLAVAAEASAEAPAPALSLGWTVAVDAVATATAAGVAPSLSAGSTVAGATATATADAVDLSTAENTLLFDPPTQDQATDEWFWGRFTVPVGISVVKVSGHYINLPTPSSDELSGAEGTDWFRGGYHYEVTSGVATALIADGYEIKKDAHVH